LTLKKVELYEVSNPKLTSSDSSARMLYPSSVSSQVGT
jgi:hypothetical protein